MSLSLGPFQIDHPFLLAPMAGITNSPFRRLMRKMGSSIVISELISANGYQHGSEKTIQMFQFHDDERVVGIQIFSEYPENLCAAAQYVEKIGADFVDLNLGCPVPKVVKKGAGSAMCRDPIALGKVLSEIKSAIKIPLTIKIRTGWDSQSINAHEVVKVAADSGVSWVAVHGRTRAQGYQGLADWDYIGEVKAKSLIPIIGNGDLNTPEVAVEKVKLYGLDAVMLGRGALRNPFIFRQCEALWSGREYKQPEIKEYLQLIEDQKVLLESVFTEEKALLHSKKFLSWYSSGFPGAHDFRKKVFSEKDPKNIWNLGREFFLLNSEKRTTSYLSGPFLMGGHG